MLLSAFTRRSCTDPTPVGSPGLVRYVAGLYNASRQDVGVSACESDSDLGFCTCSKCRALDVRWIMMLDGP